MNKPRAISRTTPLAPFARGSTTRVRWIAPVPAALLANHDRLLKALDLLPRARREGVENRPAPTDTDLDAPQLEVLNAVDAQANTLRQLLDARLAEARELIIERTPGMPDGDAFAAQVALDLKRAELGESERLVELWKTQQRKLRQMNAFKRPNGLTRDAMYAEDQARPWVLIGVLLIVETALNAMTFRMAGGGIVNGGLTAAGFAFANLFLGLGMGTYGMRFLWHTRPWLRALGVALTAGFLGVGVIFNLVVAHYRETLGEDVARSIADAFRRATSLERVWDLSPVSILLLVLGGVFFVLALHKGMGGADCSHDPYVGYRGYAKPWREASVAYTRAKLACLDGMKAIVAEAEAAWARARAEESARIDEALDVAEQAARRAEEIADSIGEHRDMAGALLTAYRDENRAVRTASSPTYFATLPDLRAMLKGLPDGAEARRLAQVAEAARQRNLVVTARVGEALARMLAARLQDFTGFIEAVEARGRREWAAEADAAPSSRPTRPAVLHAVAGR